MTENASEKKPWLRGRAVYTPEESPLPQEEGYLGSVRFFKHLILTVLALAILIPTVLSIILGVSLSRTRAELVELQKSASLDSSVFFSATDQSESSGYAAQPEELTEVSAEEVTEENTEEDEEDEGQKPEFPAYQELYPGMYARVEGRNSVDREKVVYLSFDGGPSERTPEILKILKHYDVKATFFVSGKDSERDRQCLQDIVDSGHTIGVHSYSYDYKTIYSSVEAFLDDFAQEYYLIQDATGVSPQIFRFPGGSINAYNGHIYQEIISEMTRRGFVYYDWNCCIGEAVQSDVSTHALVENALNRAVFMRRVFVMSHDNTRFTNVVDALPCIIEGYREAGFVLEALTPEVKPVIFNYLD